MALRAGFSFEHIAATNTAVTGVGGLMSGMPISFKVPVSGNTRFAALAGDGWINGFPASGAGWIGVGFDIAKAVVGNPKKSWIGFRSKLMSPAQMPIDSPVCWVGQSNYPSGSTVTVFGSTYRDFYPTLVESQAREIYIEMGFNWAEKTIDRRINGVFHSTVDASSLGADWDNKNLSVICPVCYIVNQASSVRDFYWTDNTDDPTDKFNGPLGPQRFTLLTETIDTPTTWAMQGATNLQQTIQVKVDVAASTKDLPLLNSPTPDTPLAVSVKTPTALVVGKVRGLVAMTSVGLNSGVEANLALSMKVGSDSTEKKNTVIGSTILHGKFGAVFPTAPDGSAWTKASVDSAKLILENV